MVASIYGAMFAPRPERVAAELLRVCRPGGTIAMGNWTKEGFIGTMFKTFARFIAPPGMPAPVLWGDESVVRERFGAGVSDLRLTRVNYRFDYPFAPAEVVEFFRQTTGRRRARLRRSGNPIGRRFARTSWICGPRTTRPANPPARSSTRSISRSWAFAREARYKGIAR